MNYTVPYSYIAAQRLVQFSAALDEIVNRIDHISRQQYDPRYASMPDDIRINSFEDRLYQIDGTPSPDHANILQQANFYDKILYNGAHATYQQCQSGSDAYLLIADDNEFTQQIDFFHTMAERYGYQDGRIDVEAFNKLQGGFHPDLVRKGTLRQIIMNKEKSLQAQEAAIYTFQDQIEESAAIIGSHLYPCTAQQHHHVNTLLRKIESVDLYVENICNITREEPVLQEQQSENDSQHKASENGRRILLNSLNLR